MTNISSSDNRVGEVMNLIHGHFTFLNHNTGTTNDRKTDHWVINPQGILANNRHYIADTRLEAQPDGDATTEGQSVLIIGYAMAYMATKNPLYLQKAEEYWEAYKTFFYAGQEVPTTPQRWICNWIVNGKEPVLAHYPIDPVVPTHGGFKDVVLTFVDGESQVPQGAPYYGEWLDDAYQAYDGNLGWGAVNATVYAVDSNGDTNWNQTIPSFEIEWAILWNGKKVDWDGNVLSENHPTSDFGKVKVKPREAFDPITFEPAGQMEVANGDLKFSFAPRLPVELGGRLIGRNEVQHNRPVQVPLIGTVNQMGNAADAEVWFTEACYLLWKLTGKEVYKHAMDCTLYTSNEYTDIDSVDKFFRRSTQAETPWTDGISYDYPYPSDLSVEYHRDVVGNISADVGIGAITMEQQAINYRIAKTDILEVNVGATSSDSSVDIPVLLQLNITPVKTDESQAVRYSYALPSAQSSGTTKYDIEIGKFYKEAQTTRLSDSRVYTYWGDCSYTMSFETDVLGFDGAVCDAEFTTHSGGLIYGFWLVDDPQHPDHPRSEINAITYKSDADFILSITDDDLWVWYWLIPASTDWSHIDLPDAAMVLADYQPDHPIGTRPTVPSNFTFEQCEISPAADTLAQPAHISVFNLNEPPIKYDFDDNRYILHFSLTASCTAEYNLKVGDCYMKTYQMGSLWYTPGVIPFSNIYEEYTPMIGGWHGLPYPGYQSPLTFVLLYNQTRLNNQVDFLYDSQIAYTEMFPTEVGPGMSAFVWDRWDAKKYAPIGDDGEPIVNTWIMTHWGSHAWDGYQARAYYWACRAWYELVKQSKTVPPKLIEYCEKWTTWLINYQDKYGITPTYFPEDAPAIPKDDDFTGHMCANWLGGACLIRMAGGDVTGIDNFIETTVDELIKEYHIIDHNNLMNGSWSPYVGNMQSNSGQFYGFWAGEILKSLGLYIMYKNGADFDWF